jgi:hypothetical protein
MFNIFAPIKKVLCPYDLVEIQYRDKNLPKACPNCKNALSLRYVGEFEQAPPCFAQILGYTRVGKTVFLQTLTLCLDNISLSWPGYFTASLTPPTDIFTLNIQNYRQKGVMPKPTDMGVQEAYIMHLFGMRRWGNRTLVMRDVAGEHINRFQFPIEQLPYLKYVPTALIMFESRDLFQPDNPNFRQLMDRYIETLSSHDSNYKKQRRNVIVVLSKSDEFLDEFSEPVKNYLISSGDPCHRKSLPLDDKSMAQYIAGMKTISQEIAQLVNNHASGRQMVAMAKRNGIDIVFSAISATGGAVVDGQTESQVLPRRALDPFFWVLELQSMPE